MPWRSSRRCDHLPLLRWARGASATPPVRAPAHLSSAQGPSSAHTRFGLHRQSVDRGSAYVPFRHRLLRKVARKVAPRSYRHLLARFLLVPRCGGPPLPQGHPLRTSVALPRPPGSCGACRCGYSSHGCSCSAAPECTVRPTDFAATGASCGVAPPWRAFMDDVPSGQRARAGELGRSPHRRGSCGQPVAGGVGGCCPRLPHRLLAC
jgi:hypothetical protein